MLDSWYGNLSAVPCKYVVTIIISNESYGILKSANRLFAYRLANPLPSPNPKPRFIASLKYAMVSPFWYQLTQAAIN